MRTGILTPQVREDMGSKLKYILPFSHHVVVNDILSNEDFTGFTPPTGIILEIPVSQDPSLVENFKEIGSFQTNLITRKLFITDINGVEFCFKNVTLDYYAKNFGALTIGSFAEDNNLDYYWISAKIWGDASVAGEDFPRIFLGWILTPIQTIPPKHEDKRDFWSDGTGSSSIPPMLVTLTDKDFTKYLNAASEVKKLRRDLKSTRSMLSRTKKMKKVVKITSNYNIN